MITHTNTETSALRAAANPGYVWLISVVAALGGLLFGWDWVVVGGAKVCFQRYFHLTTAEQIGWASSCHLIGCLVGALLAGALSDRFGRKRLLMLSALLFAVTSIGNALTNDFSVFIDWRILGGVAIGLASGLSPMYISEVAPAQMRGKLVAVNQLTVVVGILLAQFVDWYLVRDLPKGATDDFIRDSWFGQVGWRWMFGLVAVPSVVFLLGLFAVPESPRWLAKNGRPDQARRILEKIGGPAYAKAAAADIQTTLAAAEIQKVRFADLFAPKMMKVLVLGMVLAVYQQWCGINVIFNYSEEIFKQAGYDISDVLQQMAWTGTVNFFSTIFALGLIDKRGRRPLMLFGSAALAIIYTAMGACYFANIHGHLLQVLVLMAIASYAVSLAPVTWVVISEIFPNRIRGAAMSVAVAALWIACFTLTDTFPKLNATLGAAKTFWLYAAISVAGFLFMLFMLPETKGKSLEQIERELVD